MTIQPGFTASMGEERLDGTNLRQRPFAKALLELAAENSRIVGLSADVSKYTDMTPFAEEFPARFVNTGMAEEDLIGIAAGLAHGGFLPVLTTYAVFATRRAYDFVAMQVAYHRANVKIVCSHAGLTTGYGGSHQGIEDLALMRALPNMVVIDPADAVELDQATRAMVAYEGPVYMRLQRNLVPVVLDESTYRFEIGRAKLLRDGSDVGIVACGTMTPLALEAAEVLDAQGISVAVLNASTLKPFDARAVLDLAGRTRALVTAENHTIIGGLFSAVAEALAQHGGGIPVEPIGICDEFGDCGSLPYLARKHKLTQEAIVAAACRALTTVEKRSAADNVAAARSRP